MVAAWVELAPAATYGFPACLRSRQSSTINHGGINPVNSHHADRPVSRSRRTATPSPGNRNASDQRLLSALPPMSRNAVSPIALNRKNHQYSGRAAVPTKVAYFLRHVLIASTNPTDDLRFTVRPNRSAPLNLYPLPEGSRTPGLDFLCAYPRPGVES